jgi:integrase
MAKPGRALTKQLVESAMSESKWGEVFWDSRVPGFGVRVFPPSAPGVPARRTYVYRYRTRDGRKQRTKALGAHGPLTVEKARNMAADLYEAVRKGRDPVGDEEFTRAAAVQAQAEAALTFAALVEEWTSLHLVRRRPRYAAEAVRAIRRGLADLLLKPAAQINRADAVRALDAITKSGHAVTAWRTMAYARACLWWAQKRGIVPNNPFAGLPVEVARVERERVLTDRELRAVWAGAEALGYPFGPFYRIAMLTLQRREEVAGMRWSEINDDSTVWRIPGDRMKNGRLHEVHLSEPARAVLHAIPRVHGSDFLFTTTTGRLSRNSDDAVRVGRRRDEPTPISGFSQGKRHLDRAVARVRTEAAVSTAGCEPQPMEPWRLHDIRRTGVTHLAALGFDSIVVDKLLAHQPAKLRGVAGVYQRYEFAQEQARALDVWAAYVTGAGASGQRGDVAVADVSINVAPVA